MKIKTKILWTLLGMSLLVALVGALAVNRQYAAAIVGVTKEAKDVAHLLGFLLMSDSNRLGASGQEIVAKLHQTQGRDVVLMDSNQMVLADGITSSVGKIFTGDPGDEVGATIKDRKVRTFVEVSQDYPAGIKQMVVPVEDVSGQVIGAVVLEYTPLYNELMQLTRTTIRQVVLAGAGSVAIAVLIAFYMGRSIARPLEQLTNVATGFASGRTDLPMPPMRKDEIGELATAFNHMVQKRQRAGDELRRLRDELEVRVVERTAELAKANEGLQAENTERKRAEETLRESEERFSGAFEHAPIGVALVSSEGRWLKVNRALCDLVGYSEAELLTRTFQDITYSESLEVSLENARRIIAGEIRSYQMEKRYVHARGHLITALLNVSVVRDGQGQPRHFIAQIQDITERKLSEAALEKAHKELVEAARQAGKAEVASSVLHNVGNVLNSVNVASSCLADSLRQSKAANLSKAATMLREHEGDLGTFLTSDPKGKQLPGYLVQLGEHLAGEQAAALKELAGLQKNIEHIKHIVTMQQSFAKVSGVMETLSVPELLEDALRMNSSALARHDIQITKEFEEVPPITVDKHKMLQILVNLVTNAKQACSNSGRQRKKLVLRVTNGNDRVLIAVSDNGVGIPPENLDRIFGHGFTTKKDGHGFGLHSGALAAKEMGGSLSVQSEGAGQGATFTLELPLTID